MAWRKSSLCNDGQCIEVDFRRSSRCDARDCVEVGFKKSSRCDSGACVEVGFRRSSKCDHGQCVEVGFHKSSRSYGSSECVEVQCQCQEDKVLVRDSKQVNLVGEAGPYPVLTFPSGEWAKFLSNIPEKIPA